MLRFVCENTILKKTKEISLGIIKKSVVSYMRR